MDLKTITNNINKLTNKEKVVFIQTLLGVSVQLSHFLARMQEKILIAFPEDIHYMMVLSMANINALAYEDMAEIQDYSLNIDSYEEKLIALLKKLNEIYKDKLNDAN